MGARVRAYLKARFRCLVPVLGGCGGGAGLSKQRLSVWFCAKCNGRVQG